MLSKKKSILMTAAMLGCTLVAGNGVMTAQASLIASESFDYNTSLGTYGNLTGENGGSGWTGAWGGDTARNAVYDASSSPMTYTIATGVTVDGGNRAVHSRENIAGSRSFTTQNANDVYISFLFRYDASINTQFSQIQIGNAYIGFRGVSGAGDLSLKMGSQDASGAALAKDTGIDVALGTTYFMVAKLSKSVAGLGNQYNTGTLWVNPTSTLESMGVDGTATGNIGSSLSSLRIFGDNNSNSNIRSFDEIRVGTTWQDVIPQDVPEPASLALLLSGGLLLLGRRRD